VRHREAERTDQYHLRIADWTLDEDRHCVLRNNETKRLEPRAIQLLGHMARHAGEPLSRESLLSEVWDGVVVSDETLTTTINKIRRAFEDSSQNPKIIETIPKMGYRLIAPVSRVPVDSHSEVEPTHRNDFRAPKAADTDGMRPLPTLISKYIYIVIFAALGLAVIIGIYAALPTFQTEAPVGPATVEKLPTVTIAQFVVIGADPEQEYLARGLTADLISQLSSLSGLYVTTTSGEVSATLDRDTKLERLYDIWGGVRRSGNVLNVQVRLVEAKTGRQLWTKTFERRFDDLFEIQNAIATQLAEALSVKVTEQEKKRLAQRHTNSVEAYDLFMRAQSQLIVRRKENYVHANELYLGAITADPSFARAYAGLALVHAGNFRNQWVPNREESLDKALDFANTAEEISPDLPEIQWTLGYVKTQQRHHEQALAHLNKALALEPGFPDALALKGGIMSYLGESESTIPLLREAIRRSPAAGYLYFMVLGRAYFFLDNHVQAVINLREAAERNPGALEVRVFLAAALNRSGAYDEAEWEAAEIRAIRPDFSASLWLETHPLVDQVQIKKLLHELQRLGL